MPEQIQIQQHSYGKLSAAADCLMIGLSEHEIGFCEMESSTSSPHFITHYPIDTYSTVATETHLANAIRHFQLNPKKYKHTYINFHTSQFTLCPVAIFDSINARELLEFNVGELNSRIVLTDDVNADVKLIYAIDESLKSAIGQLFPQHQIKHNLSVLTKLAFSAEEFSKTNILLSVEKDHIELILKQEQSLQLVNRYAVQTTEDILYYVMFAIEQYQLNPANVTVAVAGNVESTSPLVLTLKKYIRTISLAKGSRSINWAGLSGMPQHYNYTLLNRLFCE